MSQNAESAIFLLLVLGIPIVLVLIRLVLRIRARTRPVDVDEFMRTYGRNLSPEEQRELRANMLAKQKRA